LLTINLKEPINTETIIQNILSSKEINTIIDLGANIGDFVLIENHYSKAKIFAFEPVEKNFNILKANLYLNNLEELVYFEKTAI